VARRGGLTGAALVGRPRAPPANGCFLFDDGALDADGHKLPMMSHLDGAVYEDPAQRASRGLPPLPHDWTTRLEAALGSVRAT
jgi:hypothetical protein